MDAVTRHPQLGQSLVIGFSGTEAAEVAPLLRRLRPAGLVLLPRNIRSAAQVQALTSGLQAIARESGLPELLIAIDQEGGPIARLSGTHGFTDTPSAMAVGAAANPQIARELATVAARELAAVGVNLDLAPVLDLALDPANTVIGTRSLGADPALVASLGSAVIDGLQQAGVLACAKHFPGHGATAVDSHLDLPRLASTSAQLRTRDLVPFAAASAVGCAAVMTAHVRSALDPDVPATLSHRTIGEVLRGDLRFDGLVLTDALEMRALDRVALPRERRGLQALRAGADLLLFEGDLELIDTTIAIVAEGLERGEFSWAAIEASGRRLAVARQRLAAGPSAPDLVVVGSAAHRALAVRIARAGLLVTGADSLPLDRPPWVLDIAVGPRVAAALAWPLLAGPDIDPGGPVVVAVDDAELASDTRAAVAQLRARGTRVILLVLSGWDTPREIEVDSIVHALDLPAGLWSAIADRVWPGVPWPTAGSPA